LSLSFSACWLVGLLPVAAGDVPRAMGDRPGSLLTYRIVLSQIHCGT
jgi:hypothetical protein